MMLAAQDIPTIRALDAAEASGHLAALAEILVDAVAQGASVNFMAGFTLAAAHRFWEAQLPGIADGSKCLLVAETGGRLLGTVTVAFALQPNAPHRAEIGKMLVHSTARRQGLGRRLLGAAEAAAVAAGRVLLVLDTETDSAGDQLYRRCGWTPVGTIPDYALTPGGRFAAATQFYKVLGPAPALHRG